VADVSLRVFNSREEYAEAKTSKLSKFFFVAILLQGRDVYWFLLLLAAFLAISLKIAGLSSIANLNSNKGIAIVVALILLSASSAEILVFLFAGTSFRRSISHVHPISWPLLIFHVALLAFIVRLAVVQRRRGVEA